MKNAPALFDRQVEIYVTNDGEVRLDVPLDREERELPKGSNIQKMHIAGADRPVTFYSLDVVISVGYRVKSPRGTQFRIWANTVLRDHPVKGYTVNQRRLGQTGLADMEQAVKLLGRTLHVNRLMTNEGDVLLNLGSGYARRWRLLLQYDENRLPAEPTRPSKRMVRLTAGQTRDVIGALKERLASQGEASALFGQERDRGLEGILAISSRPWAGRPSTQAWRRGRRTCSTSSSRISTAA